MKFILSSFFSVLLFASTANAGILPETLPEFSLVNHNGQPVTDKDLRGKILVVNFIFTRCLEACPVMTSTLVQTSKKTGPDVLYVFISLDPKRDTPERLLKYGKDYGVDFSKTVFLTGDPKDVKALLKKFKVIAFESGETINHINITGIYDKSGKLKAEIGGMDFTKEDVLKGVNKAK